MTKLLREIHRRSLWQVLGMYLVGAWVAFQVAQTMTEGMGLPHWVPPLAIVLLVIGLPVVLATAFVQQGVGRTGRVPTAKPFADPESAPAEPAADPTRPTDSAPAATVGEGAGVHHRIFTWRNASLGGAGAFLLLFGFAGLYIVIQDRGQTFAPQVAVAEEADPGIAVLPFTVTGTGLDEWREGMVELLTTNLDGTAGLRTIDSRTVMARWRERVGDAQTADLATQLDVARQTGATYLLTGAVVALGREVRLGAEIYAISTGDELGQTEQVQGHPDSVFALVDQLSIETLRTILQTDAADLPRANLARVTTTSLPALRHYLEGSAHHRNSDFERATSAFERALEADSTFALAAYRLSESYGWSEGIQSELGQRAIDLAARYADRLPDREASLVRGVRALLQGDHNHIPAIERLVQRYPDDVEAWYLLGDMYFHTGFLALIDGSESEAAFRRAIDLDPRFSPAHIHYVDLAFVWGPPDSAQAATRLAAYQELAAGTQSDRQLQLAFTLAFGEEARRNAVIAGIDTADGLSSVIAFQNLSNAQLLDAQAEVAKALTRTGHPSAPVISFFNSYGRGRPMEAASGLATSGARPWIGPEGAFHLHQLTRVVPEEAVPRAKLDSLLALGAADSTDALRVFYPGAYAADRGRAEDAETAVRWLRSAEERHLAEGDSATASFAAGAALAIEGVGTQRDGDLEGALELFEAARISLIGNYPRAGANDAVRLRIGRILMDLGRPAEAELYLSSFWNHPPHYLELARAYEALGEDEKARAAYENFVAAWHDPEPPLQPIVDEATQSLLHLTDRLESSER